MESASKFFWFQELLQKHMHLSNALLKLVLNEENRRAVEDAKLEIDMGMKALQVDLARRTRIVESSYSYNNSLNHRPDIERSHGSRDTGMAGTREHRGSAAAIVARSHLSDTHANPNYRPNH